MRKRYSFSSRRTGKIKNIRKQRGKYPELLKKILAKSDIILEILDARFVNDTRNLELEKEIQKQNKKIVYVLNKTDLVKKVQRPSITPHVLVSCKSRRGIKELRDKIKLLSKQTKKPLKEKFEKIIVGIVGYPNTGKSSLINLLIGKSSAKTGADAGFTKGIQKLRLTADIQLLDSPGVIPEEEYSNIKRGQIAQHTKVGGRSHSQVKGPEFVIARLMKDHPDILEKHYKVKSNQDSEELLEKIGKKRNFLKKGGEVNIDKTARLVLKEWQEGIIKI